MAYRIELLDDDDEVIETHLHDGDEMNARQIAVDLAQLKNPAMVLVTNEETEREVYMLRRRR